MGKIFYILLGIFLLIIGWLYVIGPNTDPKLFSNFEDRERLFQTMYIVFAIFHVLGGLCLFKAYKILKKETKLKNIRDVESKNRLSENTQKQIKEIEELKKDVKELKGENPSSDNENEDVNPYVNPKK